MKKFLLFASLVLVSIGSSFARDEIVKFNYDVEVEFAQEVDGSITKRSSLYYKEKIDPDTGLRLPPPGDYMCVGTCASGDGTMCDASGCEPDGEGNCSKLSCTSYGTCLNTGCSKLDL